MNSTTANAALKPSRALIIYEDRGTYNKDYYIESREIRSSNGKLQLMGAVPLSQDIMKDIAKSYMKTNAADMQHGFIPEHILYGKCAPGKTVVMWFRPSMKRSLNFSASLQIKGSSEVIVPATLYLLINNQLNIYALASDERPSRTTKLFNAPYFNIYADGNVCMGTAQTGNRKADTFEKEADRFERAFYMAEQNGGHNASMCKGSPSALWTQLIKSKKKFPIDKLIPHKKYKTLQQLMERVENGKD